MYEYILPILHPNTPQGLFRPFPLPTQFITDMGIAHGHGGAHALTRLAF